ncbi:hypothetical protein AOLI_G00297180 [Acnodon oligacanthus]
MNSPQTQKQSWLESPTHYASCRSASHTWLILKSEQWREIINKKIHFPHELISAIQESNTALVESLLYGGEGIIRQLDDAEDRLWREALNLSIRLGSEETMAALLRGVKFDFRQIHEALLVAVDTNQPRVVKLLLDRLDQEKGNKMDVRSFSTAIFDSSIDASQFAPGVTPLTLACQEDLYEIVILLTQRGHVISPPHPISCSCLECRNARQYDLLKFSLSRINTYRGIASRAYLSITSEDAILHAFHLSSELRKLSKKEQEFKPQYLALEQLCQEYAVELLGMCRNQSEVATVLNYSEETSDEELDEQTFEEGIPNLALIRLAITYNQKQFVTHPICQQVLSSIWCGSLSGWRGSKTTWKLLVSFGIFVTMPLLCLIYWIAPKSRIGRTLKIPVIKFLLHSASYMWFLIILLAESIFMETYRNDIASRTQHILHNSLHMIWVVGFFWFECKEVWIEGLRTYLLDWWNILDMLVLSMYLASFTLRILIVLKGHFLCQDPSAKDLCDYFTNTARENWRQEDPQLIAEVLFAVTSMLSFTRLAYILPAHESLGTLQISIGKMIDDMIRLNETFNFLFWTMFGESKQDYVDLSDYVLAGFVGTALYGIYTLIIVIVLLNMLIAMITNSFQKIENDADVEWKFARSKLYLSYFREGLTMPVPFNIIPSHKTLSHAMRSVFRRRTLGSPDHPPGTSVSGSNLNQSEGQGEGRMPYRLQVIKALVQRYIGAAHREFEETKNNGKVIPILSVLWRSRLWGDVGYRITELNNVLGRLDSEMKKVYEKLQHRRSTTSPELESSSTLSNYIKGAMNNFHNFDKKEASRGRGAGLQIIVHHREGKEERKEGKVREQGGSVSEQSLSSVCHTNNKTVSDK